MQSAIHNVNMIETIMLYRCRCWWSLAGKSQCHRCGSGPPHPAATRTRWGVSAVVQVSHAIAMFPGV